MAFQEPQKIAITVNKDWLLFKSMAEAFARGWNLVKESDGHIESGIIGNKEVVMHQLAKFVWAIDIVRHTSDDTKEFIEGWEVGDEQKALALYDEKVKEITQEVIE